MFIPVSGSLIHQGNDSGSTDEYDGNIPCQLPIHGGIIKPISYVTAGYVIQFTSRMQ